MPEIMSSVDGLTHIIIMDEQEREELISAIRGLLTDVFGEVDEGIVYEIYEGLK